MTIRERLMDGERIPVRQRQSATAGILYYDAARDAFDFECREGWPAGVTEAICFADSSYLEDSFLRTFEEVPA